MVNVPNTDQRGHRTALSTVVNICRKLPSECPAPIMDTVPRLCDLLHYELVENVIICLLKIAERVKDSPDMLNELCKHGLVKHTMHLIGINSRTNLSQTTYSNLIGLFAKLAASSSDVVTMIFELEIGSIMKHILSNYELSHDMLFPHAVEKQSNQDLWNSDKSDGVEGESAKRCRARLERHRRTVDRVAKALAEKSMRDLIAQREQAERNRFAETLDAGIKRWSNVKEGNLRALLSTLQYVRHIFL